MEESLGFGWQKGLLGKVLEDGLLGVVVEDEQVVATDGLVEDASQYTFVERQELQLLSLLPVLFVDNFEQVLQVGVMQLRGWQVQEAVCVKGLS